MQEVVWANVSGVVLHGTDFGFNVFSLDALAHNFVVGGILGFGQTLHIHGVANLIVPSQVGGEVFPPNELRIGHTFAGVAGDKNFAVVHT